MCVLEMGGWGRVGFLHKRDFGLVTCWVGGPEAGTCQNLNLFKAFAQLGWPVEG